MSDNQHNPPVNGTQPANPSEQLIDGEKLLETIFPEDCRPCLRTLERLVKKRIIPSIKLGHRRYYSPTQVREALLRGGAR